MHRDSSFWTKQPHFVNEINVILVSTGNDRFGNAFESAFALLFKVLTALPTMGSAVLYCNFSIKGKSCTTPHTISNCTKNQVILLVNLAEVPFMSFFKQFVDMKSDEFAVPWISVPVFNLAKYVLLTYIVGLAWDFAHIRVIETKRYMSLWYTGKLTVASFGRSRNNLFSGNNFETLCTALQRYFNFSMQEKVEKEDVPMDSMSPGRVSSRCVLFEVASIGLIILVVCAEAASEVYTRSAVQTSLQFGIMSAPVRRHTSEVLFGSVFNHSMIADITFTRRCSIYNEEGQQFVTRPNIIVQSGKFDHGRGEIPRFDLSKMCFFDAGDRSAMHQVNHTLFESLRNIEARRVFTDKGVILITAFARVLGNLAIPHFSNIALSKEDLRRDSQLLLVELNGNNYTCTRIYTWCVRIHKGAYEVIFSSFAKEMDEVYKRNKSWSLFDYSKSFTAVYPFRISLNTLPLLASDRFMMRPRLLGPYISDIEDNINILAMGYTYGWTTEELKNQRVIIGRKTGIVPTVQVGYVIAVCAILLSSCLILVTHRWVSRKRKITGLVGEHAFIDRWHGHLVRDGKYNHTQGRTQLIVSGSCPGVGHLQPPVNSSAFPMSSIDKMM